MTHLKHLLSLPVCVAAVGCSQAGSAGGGKAVPETYRGVVRLDDRQIEPQAASKEVVAFSLPESSRQASDYSAPVGFSKFSDPADDAMSGPAPAAWHPAAQANFAVPSGAAVKASDFVSSPVPVPDRSKGLSGADKPVD